MKKFILLTLVITFGAALLGCSSSNDDTTNVFMTAQGRVDSEGATSGIQITVAAQVVSGQSDQVTIEWGDGSQETVGQSLAIAHTYATPGTRTLTFTSVGEATEVEVSLSMIDNDSDWYVSTGAGTIRGADCNDSNAAVNPEAAETAGDGEDSNCNGAEAT